MSLDLYLLPAAEVGTDADLAEAYARRANEYPAEFSEAPDPACERRKRELADLLLRLEPSFEEFKFSFEAIAASEGIGVDEARRKYRQIEINGPSVEAQFSFHDQYVAISWYSMPAEEMHAVLAALSRHGEFVAFDPQRGRVVDVRNQRSAAVPADGRRRQSRSAAFFDCIKRTARPGSASRRLSRLAETVPPGLGGGGPCDRAADLQQWPESASSISASI